MVIVAAHGGLHQRDFRAMGSDNRVVLSAPASGDAGTAQVAERVVADVLRIERKYSRYRDDSVTAAINRSAGADAVAIDTETASLLGYAAVCHAESGGRFDITSGALRTAWDFGATAPRRPDATALADALRHVGWAAVEHDAHHVRLARAGMQLDFGGIGKEYAADRVATIAQESGVRHGFVNLGGDVRAWGGNLDGRPWRIGIRHPRSDAMAVGGVDLIDGAVATSGDYERFIEIDGQRYCHLLDARSGMPVTFWRSISVVAPLAIVAGSHATIGMLMQADAPAWLDAAGLRWLGVDADGTRCGTLSAQDAPQSPA